MTCTHATSGCDYPTSECAGQCEPGKQSEALRLASIIEMTIQPHHVQHKAAAELRRLYAENQKLRTALEQQTVGHDKTLDELRIAEQDARELLAALRACDEAMSYMSEYDIPLTLPAQVKAAIAKATGEQQ